MHNVLWEYSYKIKLMGIRRRVEGQLFRRDDGHFGHSVGINHLHLEVGQVDNQSPVHLLHALHQHFVSLLTGKV